MKKNRHDQKGANGIEVTAFGYTMNARPGPDVAILSIGMLRSLDMKPKKEKITKPARKLVNEFTSAIMALSLWTEMDSGDLHRCYYFD